MLKSEGNKKVSGKGKKKGKKPGLAREIRGASHPYEEGTTNPHLKEKMEIIYAWSILFHALLSKASALHKLGMVSN